MADNAEPKQPRRGPGRPFQRGQSGNPAGMRPGTRHRATMLAEKLMGDDIESVVRAVVKAAKDGDMTAARLVLDRIAPPRRASPVLFSLPPVETVADVTKALGSVLARVARGELTPDEGIMIAGLLDAKRKAIETAE